MAVFDYIDTEVLSPVYQNKLPVIKSRNVDRICKELYYTIKSNEPVFIYGDYDMDGLCCVKVWEEVLQTVYDVPPLHFSYINRQHSLDRHVVEQAQAARARIVLICDTGSGREDRNIISLLRANGHTPIVIDHHVWDGNYKEDCQNMLVYNSYEERELLGGEEVSGAYSCLLVANWLCLNYLNHSLSYNAMVYALASMYSDVVDMSTKAGRALYNVVSVIKMPQPDFFAEVNAFGYSTCKRLFSFLVAPKVNACFRMESFGPLNQVMGSLDKFGMKSAVQKLCEVHNEASQLTSYFIPQFTRESYGPVRLCVHTVTEETQRLHIRNFSGLVANAIANEEKSIAIALIKNGVKYEGSYRDFYNRKLLETFKLFCEAGGHDTAFGMSVTNLSEMQRHLIQMVPFIEHSVGRDYETISSSIVSTKEDIQVLALYNEYRNVRPRVLINHRCSRATLLRSTRYRKFYNVGLPYEVSSTLPIIEGSFLLIEPTITKAVELRCVD